MTFAERFACYEDQLNQIVMCLKNHGEVLDLINTKNELILEIVMATQAQMEEAFAQLNTATNAVAAELTRLRDTIAAGGLTPEQEQDVLNRLTAASAALSAMAVSPTNPVPVPPPPPTA